MAETIPNGKMEVQILKEEVELGGGVKTHHHNLTREEFSAYCSKYYKDS